MGGDGIPAELFNILKDDAIKMLYSTSQKIWKTQQWPQDWKSSVSIPIPNKGKDKERSNYCTIAFISYASKAKLKILQAMLQQYVNWKLPDGQAGFRKDSASRDQIANIQLDHRKMQRDSKNTIYFCFVDYAETFHSVDDKKLRKILKQMGLTDHLTCLLGNLYAGQEAS